MIEFRRLPGLPPYGPQTVSFPPEFGRHGREGVVVEFRPNDGTPWIGNFAPGHGGVTAVLPHPDGRRILVIVEGLAWLVDPESGDVERLEPAVHALWPVSDPDGYLFDEYGLWFSRLGAAGFIWRTERISWDGFADIVVNEESVTGRALSPIESEPLPFVLDIRTGSFTGGSYNGP